MTRALVAVIAGIVWIGGSLFVFVFIANRRSYPTFWTLRIIFPFVLAAVGGMLLLLLLRAH